MLEFFLHFKARMSCNMNIWLSFIVTFFSCCAVAEAARRVDAQLRAKVTMQRRRELSAHMKRDLEPLDTTTLFELTEDEDLEQSTEMPAASGMTVEKLKETYKGIEVYDTSVAVRRDKNGQLTGDAVGQLVQGIDEDIPDINGLLSDEETIAIAANAEGDSVDLLKDVTVRRQIFIHNNGKAHLANFVSYRVLGFKRPMYIIDKNDGTILRHWDGLTTYPCCEKGKFHGVGGNEIIGKFTYGSMPYCVKPTIVDDFCFLENDYVKVVDMKNEYRMYNKTIDTTASFECMVGYNDSVNGAYSPALDAFFYGTVVGKMYEEWFGLTALEEQIVMLVHVGEQMGEAFWDGKTCCFGDGDNTMYPLTGLDVVSHEIAHGVTEQSSGLEYWDESGGINEAFSDIMGVAAEVYLQFKSNFYIGENVMKSRPYLREFENPSNDNYSISHVSEMANDTDPHYSSGVYRRVFYLLIKTYDLPIRETVEVFLRANRLYWHNSASFYDASCGLLQAAIDLGIDTIPFRGAFADVGIDMCFVKSHIFALNNNETAQNITVGEFVHPTFRFEAPKWADMLVVSTSVYSDNDVHIRVMKDGWEETVDPCDEDDGGTFIAEGENFLTIGSAADAEYFITMTPSKAKISYSGPLLVNLTIGYTCKTDWYGPYIEQYFYRSLCGLEIIW